MLAILSRLEARLFAHVERTIHSRFDRMEALMSTKSDALMSALSDLKSAVTKIQTEGQAKIDAAVAAHQAQDDSAFDAAISEVRGMVDTVASHADATHQAAEATGTDPVITAADPAAAPVVPVPVSETATTDPTGTGAGTGIANNIPDGAHNTGAPADANDPLTGEEAAVVGEDPRTTNI